MTTDRRTSTSVSDEPVQDFADGMDDDGTEAGTPPYRYRQQRLLGKGGNGVVLSVFDRKMKRPVALKLNTSSDSDHAATLRFLREARVTGQLNHPNVMPVYDIGSEPSGRSFFTMKEVVGQSLAERIHADTAGSLVERLLIFRQVCNAVAFAHSRGVLHRDIKPANVMIGSFGEVLVVDWGLCKVTDEADIVLEDPTPSGPLSAYQTQVGDVAGTPAFMAPEQARGDHEGTDMRTDVYALGALLYALLVGSAPFTGDVDSILERVKAGDVPEPRTVDNRRVPQELNAIIMAAMATDIDERYPTVAALSADVQAFLEERPVSVLQYSPVQRMGKWATRNRRVLRPVGLTAALAAAALASGGLVHFNRVSEARDAAIAEAQRASEAERDALIEAVNGRAAVATSEALYGRAGAALTKLKSVRDSMVALDTDTLRADLGIAMLEHTSVQPSVIGPLDFGIIQTAMTDSGDRYALLTQQSISICPTADSSACVHQDLSRMKRSLGPWESSGIWLLENEGAGVIAEHTVSGSRVEFRSPLADCDGETVEFHRGWVTRECNAQGIVKWAWTDPERGTHHASQDVKQDLVSVSDSGERMVVHRMIHSTSQYDARFMLMEQGQVIWNAARGQMNVLSPNGEWILSSNATGFEATHLESTTVETVEINVPTRLIWRHDSSGFSLVTTTGEVVQYSIVGRTVTEAARHRLAVDSTILLRGSTDRAHQRFLFHDSQNAYLFRTSDTAAPVVELGFRKEIETCTEAAISPDGSVMAIGTDSGRLLVVDVQTGWILHTVQLNADPIRGLSFHPQGHQLATGHWDGVARIWDLARMTVVNEFAPTGPSSRGGPSKITEVLFLDANRLLITGGDGHIGVWSTESNAQLADFTGAVSYVWDSAYSASRDQVVVSNRLGKKSGVRSAILDLATGAVQATVLGNTQSYGVAMAPDGQRFVVGSNDGTATVAHLDGTIEQTLTISTPPAYAAAWSTDGRVVAVSDYSGRYQIWTTDTWEMIGTFGHGVIASALVFTPNSRQLNIVTGTGGLYHLDFNGTDADASRTPQWLSTVRDFLRSGNLAAAEKASNSAAETSTMARVYAHAIRERIAHPTRVQTTSSP